MRTLLRGAVCIVWLVVLPLLVANSAQGHGDGSSASVGINPPNSYPHLDWKDEGTAYDPYIDQAKLWWNDAGRIVIGRTIYDTKVDVRVSDYSECDTAVLGYYSTAGGYNSTIRFNSCNMSWTGGDHPVFGPDLPPASNTLRQHVVVHEFGHAMGLDHNNWNPCNSILRGSVPPDVTCAKPTAHDISDIQNMWP
jgi:hypothetical protein